MKKLLVLMVGVVLVFGMSAYGVDISGDFSAPTGNSDDISLVPSSGTTAFQYVAPQETTAAFSAADAFTGAMAGGFIIGLALQGMDISKVDFSKLSIDPVAGTLTASSLPPLPTGKAVDVAKLDTDMAVVSNFAKTFADWKAAPDTEVKLDEAGHPVNEAGQAIINDKGDTAAPTGKVISVKFEDFEKQFQVVKNCQLALVGAKTDRQKEQSADNLAKAVTLLQNMDNAF